ncbi:hypothetical protein GOA80_21830 [Sinorhizobium meliloti]|nr:hypothetical protein [Sinorhizobium meliloti]MDX0275756.1 hypothetical protein [Sinorhizobium meliloti]
MVKAEDFMRLAEKDAIFVLKVVADRYGRKMADDLADQIVRTNSAPQVNWPSW